MRLSIQPDHNRTTLAEWWRRGELNPRPNKSHTGFYARVRLLILALFTAGRQAMNRASIHIDTDDGAGCSPRHQTCCRRSIGLADINHRTSRH